MDEPQRPENAVHVPKFLYRGFCTECDWKGKITKWQYNAKKDAEEHGNQYSHKTDVIEIDVPDTDEIPQD
jgi:hypothetical protein